MTLFDEQGNKTPIPNKERQIEALQLLFLLLPQANRSLLKLLLDLLYHTAKQQDKNKMSSFNLALMFAPHVLWPRHVRVIIYSILKILRTRNKNFANYRSRVSCSFWKQWGPDGSHWKRYVHMNKIKGLGYADGF